MKLEPVATPNTSRRASLESGELNLQPVSAMKATPAQSQLRDARSQSFEGTPRKAEKEVKSKAVVATRDAWDTRASAVGEPVSAPSVEADEWAEVTADDAPFISSTPSVPSTEEPLAEVQVEESYEPQAANDDGWGDVDDEFTPTGDTPVIEEAPAPTVEQIEAPATVEVEDDGWGDVDGEFSAPATTPVVAKDEAVAVPKSATSTSQTRVVRPESTRKKVSPKKRAVAPKSVPRKKPSRPYAPVLQPADILVLRALARLRYGSVEHIRSLLMASEVEDMNLSHDAIYSRLARLQRASTPYVVNRPGTDVSGTPAPFVWAVTEFGIQISDPDAYSYLPALLLDTNRFETSAAHLAIQASYVSTLDARKFLPIHDVTLRPRIASAMDSGAYYPNWSPEMDPYAEAHELAIYVPGRRFPHEPDLVVLNRYFNDATQDWEHTIAGCVEVETSIKPQGQRYYEELLAGYKQSGTPVLYLVHNTALVGSTSRAGINRIYNTVRRAAGKVWLVPEDRVDSIDGFDCLIVDDSWKGTDPAGRLREEREEREAKRFAQG